MKFFKKNRIQDIVFSAWIVLAVVALVLSVNVSYAHYEREAEAKQLEFALAESGSAQVYLNSDETGWTEDDSGCYHMSFTLVNGVSSEVYASDMQELYIRVFATVEDTATADEEGTMLQESELTLTVDGCELTGVPVDVAEGSVFYTKYGPGQVYRFCTESGEEVGWTLNGGRLSAISMELKVEGGTPGTVYTVMTAEAES